MLGQEEGKLNLLWCMRIVQSQHQAEWSVSMDEWTIKSMSFRFGSKPAKNKLTFWTTCTTSLDPGETEVPLAGKPILTRCAEHVVVKAANNAAIAGVNFIVVVESLNLIDSLYIYNVWKRLTSTLSIEGDDGAFLFCQACQDPRLSCRCWWQSITSLQRCTGHTYQWAWWSIVKWLRWAVAQALSAPPSPFS